MNGCVGMLNKTQQKRTEPSGSVLNRTEFEHKISARFPKSEPSTSISPSVRFGS
ncbi:hypothetical protein HanRHA438_Chr16g0777631 [Helianthus annuus]|nr:hypothetical protein HanRHA438_Chr16g0777631 [Helianthus annuus]